jgi:hypothetical protein
LKNLPKTLKQVIKNATKQVTKTLSSLGKTLNQVLSLLGGNGSNGKKLSLNALLNRKTSHPNATSETQTLLQYLLSP